MHKILVSRCLLGQRVRYDGQAFTPIEWLLAWQKQGRIIAICPEVDGGLTIPRPPAEILNGQGCQVLDGQCPVMTIDGQDVREAFLKGAHQALDLARKHHIRLAVLKARSPSCGNRETYDGHFRGRCVPGEGVTAAALRRMGVIVFNEMELEKAAVCLAALETDLSLPSQDFS